MLLCSKGFRLLFLRNVLLRFLSLVVLNTLTILVFEEPCEAQTLTSQEVLQTPNVSSQRLSVGMTPKTLRLPKPGEMLLSVHGSPLGVYKENNMEAIYESEED
nr:uncharacterized protein LOC112726197 [Arachis hypogaea]